MTFDQEIEGESLEGKVVSGRGTCECSPPKSGGRGQAVLAEWQCGRVQGE